MAQIERQLHLEFNKWDTQVGDERILANQPLILAGHEWDRLCLWAEQLAAETVRLELKLLGRAGAAEAIGVPKSILRIPGPLEDQKPVAATRTMRFDFHPTADGWCVSEVNSDVPGGWNEGSMLPILYFPFCAGLELPDSPLEAWLKSMQKCMRTCSWTGRVALLSAPGFLEDQQVVLAFMRQLRRVNIACSLIQSPADLHWRSSDACTLRSGGEPVSAVVRFYQIEWLCNLPAGTGWKKLLQASQIAVTNPAISAISESKRFPLAFNETDGCLTWKKLMPECRDTREVASTDWDHWVLKGSYSNTGDRVYLGDALKRRERERLISKAKKEPMKWMAQRRFQTLPLESRCGGVLYPCIGVFVVDGRAAGAYVRLARKQVTDGAAKEAPLFIDRATSETA